MSYEGPLVPRPFFLTASSAIPTQVDGRNKQIVRRLSENVRSKLARASLKSRIRRLDLDISSAVCRIRWMRLLATPIQGDESSEAPAAPAPFPNHPGVPADAV